MTTPAGKGTKPIDYLLEKTVDLQNQQADICQALNGLAQQVQALYGAVAAIHGQTSADSARIEAVRATAIASVERLQQISRGGAVTEVKHVARDSNGDITTVITTKPPASAA